MRTVPAALVVSVLAAACAAHRAAPENRVSCAGPHLLADTALGRLQGRATSVTTDAPAAGVTVSVSSPGHHRTTVTDARGEWLLGDLPEGRYNVVLHRDGQVLYSHLLQLCPEDVVKLRTPIRI